MRSTFEFELSQLATFFDETPKLDELTHAFGPITRRPIRSDDYEQVGKLDYLTIQNTAEASGESEADLIQEMLATFDGKYGDIIETASLVVEIDGRIVSAIIVVLYRNEEQLIPLVANAMTHPEFQRQQLMRMLIKHSAASLMRLEYERIFFAIHPENMPSLHLANRYDPNLKR